MLANFQRKKANGGRRKKKDEDVMPDDERAAELQGWLEVSSSPEPHIGRGDCTSLRAVQDVLRYFALVLSYSAAAERRPKCFTGH